MLQQGIPAHTIIRHRLLIEPKRGQWQAVKDFGERLRRQIRRRDAQIRKSRQGPGCARRIGYAQGDAKTLRGNAPAAVPGPVRVSVSFCSFVNIDDRSGSEPVIFKPEFSR